MHSTPTVVAAPIFGYRDYEPGTANLFETAKYSGSSSNTANQVLPERRHDTDYHLVCGQWKLESQTDAFPVPTTAPCAVSACTGAERPGLRPRCPCMQT